MALTIRDIAVDLDSHVRYAAAGKTNAQIAYQVGTINRALEEMRVACPQAFRASIPITWTSGTTVTTAVSGAALGPTAGFASYAAGCSLNIAGDESFNELAAVGDGTSVSRLLFPFSGSDGSYGVRVYGDCVKLAAAVDRVLGCELLHERRPLVVLNSRAEWLAYQRPNDYGILDYGQNEVLLNITRQPGVPRAIWVEQCITGSDLEFRAHCAPLPNGEYRATLDVATMAEDITAADIAGDDSLLVTGNLSPDVTGTYALLGKDGNGKDFYAKAGSTIDYSHPYWRLSPPGGIAVWQNFDSTPVGSYSPAVTATGTATVTASGSAATRPVPGARVYGILRALCLYHWSGAPWFKNDSARTVINQDYQNALQQLGAFRPNAAAGVSSVLCY